MDLAIAELIPEDTQMRIIINNLCVKIAKYVYTVLNMPQEKDKSLKQDEKYHVDIKPSQQSGVLVL